MPHPALPQSNFTVVPNYILDFLMPKLTGCELRVLLLIVRKTIGWARRSCHIHREEMTEACGAGRSAVGEAVGVLESWGVIDVSRDEKGYVYTVLFDDPQEPEPYYSDQGPESGRPESGSQKWDKVQKVDLEAIYLLKKEEKEKETRARADKNASDAPRVDCWIYELAAAAGKRCARFAKAEREYLIAQDEARREEVREQIESAVGGTPSTEISDIVLQAAGFDRGRPKARAPMPRQGFSSSRPPAPRYEPPQRPKRATTAEIHQRSEEAIKRLRSGQ